MYGELVKRLHRCASEAAVVTDAELMIVARDAADAIEELSKYANTMRRLKRDGWYLQQSKFHDGYQAVSTMPLPEPPKEDWA